MQLSIAPNGRGDDSSTFSRTVSMPALPRDRRLINRALFAATESGNVDAMRALALQADADLTGGRSCDRQGNEPGMRLAQLGHLTPSTRDRMRREFDELPLLVGARKFARLATGIQGAEPASAGLAATNSFASAGFVAPSKARTLKDRVHSVEFAMTSLAGSLSMSEVACQAALAEPQLLRASPAAAARALPALARSMKSEELALDTVTRNPKLLTCSNPENVQGVVAVLTSILGSSEEAAYALANCPGLLREQHPQLFRVTLKAIADCLNSTLDAVWLVVQTIVPSLIKVSARPWCHDELVGEYSRVQGARLCNRPVYRKSADSLKHHKNIAAHDIHLVFSEAEGEDRWLFTKSFDKKGRGQKKYSGVREESLAQVLAACSSPDQAKAVWRIPATSSDGSWKPDPHLQVTDGSRRQGACLLTLGPTRIRTCFNQLRSALGTFWLGCEDRLAADNTRFVANLQSGDTLHLGKCASTFKDLGNFTAKNQYSYVMTTPAARTRPLTLLAWEPLSVLLLYLSDPKVSVPQASKELEDSPKSPQSKANAKPKAARRANEPKDTPKAPKLKGAATTTANAAPNPGSADSMALANAGWRAPPNAGLRVPEISTGQAIGHVFIRSFLRGHVEIPKHVGPGEPPLVFVQASISAESGGSSATSRGPCEIVDAKGGAPIFLQETMPDAGDNEWPRLGQVGDFGHSNGYSFVRTRAQSGPSDTSVTSLRIDTAESVKIILTLFHLPHEETEPSSPQLRGTATKRERTGVGKKGQKDAGLSLPILIEPPPSLPSWIAEENWLPLQMTRPTVLFLLVERRVPAMCAYEKDFGPGMIHIRSSGAATAVVFVQSKFQPCIDHLHTLLLQWPTLLHAGDNIALLANRLRIELGSSMARRALMEQSAAWSKVCACGTAADVKSWVQERKLDAFDDELHGTWRARKLVEEAPGLLDLTVTQLRERCTVLRDTLGCNDAVQDLISRKPGLLNLGAEVLQRSMTVLKSVFDPRGMRRFCSEHAELLPCAGELEDLIAALRNEFPEITQPRLCEFRTTGEWARWPDLVGRPGTLVTEWLGRLRCEERLLSDRCPPSSSQAIRPGYIAPSTCFLQRQQ